MAKGKVTLTDEERRAVAAKRQTAKDRAVYDQVVRGQAATVAMREEAQKPSSEFYAPFTRLLCGHPSQTPRMWTKGELRDLIKEETASKYTGAPIYGVSPAYAALSAMQNTATVVQGTPGEAVPCGNPAWDYDSRDLLAVCNFFRDLPYTKIAAWAALALGVYQVTCASH